jgi:hypothetical protein
MVVLTLHYTSMVGRKPQAVFRDIDVHLICKIDRLEKLVQRPRRAGDSPEDRGNRSRALGLHGDGVRGCGGEYVLSLNGEVCLELRKIDLVS